MMKDHELLERAAKAAGIEFYGAADSGHVGRWIKQEPIPGLFPTDCRHWNPLADDGDALRLAVRLQLAVNPFDGHTIVTLPGLNTWASTAVDWGDDEAAATRRAIVRAAASMVQQ